MSDKPIYCEPKYDGYRCQIHLFREDGEQRVKAFSRRQKDITDSLPELYEIDWPDGEWIIDGEVMASDESYGTTSEMVGSTQDRDLDGRDEYAVFHLFDLIYDDEMGDQSRRRYEKRRAGLVLFCKRIKSEYVEVVPAFGFAGQDDPVSDALDYAEQNDYEGIIVKENDAEYEFGKRSKSWVKMKNTEETVDLTIAGFEEGERSNAGTLGGVRLETADGVYVGNMGTGFTDYMRDRIWHNKSQFAGATVEVTAEGFGTNDELRFPRFERMREEDGEPDAFARVKEVMDDV